MPRLVEAVRDVPTAASGDYRGLARSIALGWKEGQLASATTWMSFMLAASVLSVTPVDLSRVAVVPVPATRRSRRARGGDQLGLLAHEVTRRLRAVGLEAGIEPVVRLKRQTRDQSGLGAKERYSNVSNAFEMRCAPRAAAIVAVDDILTTGATMSELLRVLLSADIQVVGAAVALATPATSIGMSKR